MNQAIARQENKHQGLAEVAQFDGPNRLARLNMRELKEVAQVFIQSGSFTDVKQVAQAMVKIMAGAELGFSPIVSMTGVHFFNGKVSLGANLIASLIKDSGRYEYKVTEHTTEACSVHFYQKISSIKNAEIAVELKSLGVAVRYTFQDATKAGLTGKDNWKKYPMDMLFAACIRQGARRYCADILRGVTPETDVDAESEVDRTAFDGAAEPNVVEHHGETVDTTTGEVIDAEVVHEEESTSPHSSSPKTSTAVTNGQVKAAVDLAYKLQKEHNVDAETLAMQFLPEGVAKFSSLTEEQAAGIVPGLAELLNSKINA